MDGSNSVTNSCEGSPELVLEVEGRLLGFCFEEEIEKDSFVDSIEDKAEDEDEGRDFIRLGIICSAAFLATLAVFENLG